MKTNALLLIFLSAGLSQAAAQLPPKDNYVLTETEAYVLLPAEFVAAPIVRRAVWSKDGRYLLVVRESNPFTPDLINSLAAGTPPQGQISADSTLVVWSSQTRKAAEVWKSPVGEGGIEEMHWLPKSGVALLRAWRIRPAVGGTRPGQAERVTQVIRLNAALGQTRVLAEYPATELAQIHVSPSRPYALFQRIQPEHRQIPQPDGTVKTVSDLHWALQVIRENGTAGPPIPRPVSGPMQVEWSASGAEPILKILDREATMKRREEKKTADAIWRWFALDSVSGRVTTLAQPPEIFRESPFTSPIRIKAGVTEAKEGATTARIQLLWLESVIDSPHPRALVASNVENAELSPTGDAILHVAQGSALVTPIMKISRALLTQMQEKARQTTAISNAKQLGLALHMYAQDFDKALPGPEGVNDKIRPYLKNDSLFDGFIYNFAGGPLKDIANPAETELGWVNGPGGRAIIYVDGHVKWRPD